MFHWTEHNIRIHVLTCVLALQIAHLLRLQAERTGLHMSVRELLRPALQTVRHEMFASRSYRHLDTAVHGSQRPLERDPDRARQTGRRGLTPV